MQWMGVLGIIICTLGVVLGSYDVIFDLNNGYISIGILFELFGIALILFSVQLKKDKEEKERRYLEDRDREIRSWRKIVK